MISQTKFFRENKDDIASGLVVGLFYIWIKLNERKYSQYNTKGGGNNVRN
jgi:hypothetical protein